MVFTLSYAKVRDNIILFCSPRYALLFKTAVSLLVNSYLVHEFNVWIASHKAEI